MVKLENGLQILNNISYWEFQNSTPAFEHLHSVPFTDLFFYSLNKTTCSFLYMSLLLILKPNKVGIVTRYTWQRILRHMRLSHPHWNTYFWTYLYNPVLILETSYVSPASHVLHCAHKAIWKHLIRSCKVETLWEYSFCIFLCLYYLENHFKLFFL